MKSDGVVLIIRVSKAAVNIRRDSSCMELPSQQDCTVVIFFSVFFFSHVFFLKAKRKQSQKKRPVRNLWSPDYKELTDNPVTTEDVSANSHMLQNRLTRTGNSLSSSHNTHLNVCNTQQFFKKLSDVFQTILWSNQLLLQVLWGFWDRKHK